MYDTPIKLARASINPQQQQFPVLGLPVDFIDMQGTLSRVENLVRTAKSPSYIVAANPEKIYTVRSNSFLKEFFKRAELVIPDGIGVVMAMRWLHKQHVSRVAGADLMQSICAAAPDRGYRIFIFGATEEVNTEAVNALRRRCPGIQIVGRANGFLDDREMPALIQKINNLETDILFVALGSPKQEEWMQRWLPSLNVKVCQGIGGTLDTIVGRVKRAPIRWQRLGLEWLYRLFQEPTRIWRQLSLIRFAAEILLAKLKVEGQKSKI